MGNSRQGDEAASLAERKHTDQGRQGKHAWQISQSAQPS